MKNFNEMSKGEKIYAMTEVITALDYDDVYDYYWRKIYLDGEVFILDHETLEDAEEDFGQCDDDYRSYEEGVHEEILYAAKDVDLVNYIKLYNMNESSNFVRILTSDWKISKAVPWIIKDSWRDDNAEISSYAIEELNRLGIKIQKVYKELKWDE